MIGSGIAGLGAAHALRRAHDVEVFERDGRAGGHANTVEVDRGDGSLLALDTGFLVHNRHNYPLLTRLFGDLGVRTQDSDMSFGVSCARCRLEYSAVRLWTQPRTRGAAGHGAAAGRDRPLPDDGPARAGGAPRAQHPRRLRAHRGLLALLPRPLRRAVRRGAVVTSPDQTLGFPPRTPSGSSRTTACSVSAATAGGRSPAAAAATSSGSPRPSGTASTSARGCGRSCATPTA